MISECSNATTSVTAHRAWSSVGVGINHFKVEIWMILKKHNAVTPDTKTAVAKVSEEFYININCFVPVVD
ncbi:hypothetical protein D3C80_1594340 [compost metagenome]